MEPKRASRKILMLPWLAYGHISPFLELAKRLSQHHFQIYLCSSPANLQSVRPRLPEKFSSSIELVDLNLSSSPDLPPHLHTTNGLPLHLISTLFKAFDTVTPQISSILTDLKPDLLIVDFLRPQGAQQLALSLNIPVTTLLVIGAAVTSHFLHPLSNQSTEYPFSELDMRDHWVSDQHANEDAVLRFRQWFLDLKTCSDLMLVNSFTEIEGKYIDYLSELVNKKVVPVGPLLQEVVSGEEGSAILRWLDRRDPNSTVYVSFGSEFYLCENDRDELAHGLELSGVNFIWVLRFPKGEKISIEEALPDGFLQRVGDKGVVVDGWAPQMEILRHPGVGGFVCHCGWNSVLEAIVLGVPIIALPMQLDHPWHARVAVAAGVGVEAERDHGGGILREGVAKAIREAVFEKRVDLKRRVTEISEGLKGREDQSMQGFVAEFDRLLEGRKVD